MMSTGRKALLCIFVLINASLALLCAMAVWMCAFLYYFEQHVPPDLGAARMARAEVFVAIAKVSSSSVMAAAGVACLSAYLLKVTWGRSVGKRFVWLLAIVVGLIVLAGSMPPTYEFFNERAPFF